MGQRSWRWFSRPLSGVWPAKPGPTDRPAADLPRGCTVRLLHKPDAARRVIDVRWHAYRRTYVYIVETSAGDRFDPYWFQEQLLRTPGEGSSRDE